MERTYMWASNVIRSCNNDYHFGCADALIHLFEKKYGSSDLLQDLQELRQHQWVSVHSILV